MRDQQTIESLTPAELAAVVHLGRPLPATTKQQFLEKLRAEETRLRELAEVNRLGMELLHRAPSECYRRRKRAKQVQVTIKEVIQAADRLAKVATELAGRPKQSRGETPTAHTLMMDQLRAAATSYLNRRRAEGVNV